MSYYETNPPWVMGASLHTVTGMGSSLHTVFPMGSPPTGSLATGPANISAGLVGWYDATTLGLSSGASVSSWPNRAASSNTLSCVTVANQPTFQSASTYLNGLAAVRFDGIANYIQSAFTLVQPSTVMIAGSCRSITNNARLFDGATVNKMAILTISGINLRLFAGVNLDAGKSIATATPFVVTGIYNGSACTILLNGAGASGNGGTNDGGGITIAAGGNGSSFFAADVGEAVVYNRSLTAAEISTIGSYLSTKWGAP